MMAAMKYPHFPSQILVEKLSFQANTGTELGIEGAAHTPP